MNIVPFASPTLTMTSREIADLTGRLHGNVMRDIRVMLDAIEQDSNLNPVCKTVTYVGTNGQSYDQYELDKDACLTLLLGYDAVARMRVVKRWQQLEEQALSGVFTVPQDLPGALRLAADLAEQKAIAEQERDHAIATKAQIGSKREATAMAKASAATRRAERLADELGQNARHATVIAVEKATGSSSGTFDWRPLKKWCEQNGVTAVAVPCARYGEAKAWPAGAWLAAYNIDLATVFPALREAA